jgi:hypothetical protein
MLLAISYLREADDFRAGQHADYFPQTRGCMLLVTPEVIAVFFPEAGLKTIRCSTHTLRGW